MVGFTGFGTLGGGNVSIAAGRTRACATRGDAALYVNGMAARSQG